MAALPVPKVASLDLRPPGVDAGGVASTRREVVTVAVKKEDYERLKAAGGPDPEHIRTALAYYVDLVRETGRRPRRGQASVGTGAPWSIFRAPYPSTSLMTSES
jgi:hypothetical protein